MRRWLLALAFALTAGAYVTSTALADKPEIDPTYANGQTVYMIGPHVIPDAPANLHDHAEELYLAVYPLNPTGSTTLGPLTLPSGYKPQCDPCFHPGVPPMFAYHDHVITGAPGMGTAGTAGVYKAPWKIILLVYNPLVAFNLNFHPVTSAAGIDAGEQAGMFLPINPGGANPYEIDTGSVLICPTVSSHA